MGRDPTIRAGSRFEINSLTRSVQRGAPATYPRSRAVRGDDHDWAEPGLHIGECSVQLAGKAGGARAICTAPAHCGWRCGMVRVQKIQERETRRANRTHSVSGHCVFEADRSLPWLGILLVLGIYLIPQGIVARSGLEQ